MARTRHHYQKRTFLKVSCNQLWLLCPDLLPELLPFQRPATGSRALVGWTLTKEKGLICLLL